LTSLVKQRKQPGLEPLSRPCALGSHRIGDSCDLSPHKKFCVLPTSSTKTARSCATSEMLRQPGVLLQQRTNSRPCMFVINPGRSRRARAPRAGRSNGQSITLPPDNAFPLSALTSAQLRLTFCLSLDTSPEIRKTLREMEGRQLVPQIT